MPKRSDSFIKEKPVRGREMKTTVIPGDMFETMKLVSAKKTLKSDGLTTELEKPTDNKLHLYHEGYIDGKLYMVPDENLEQMKADVHTKLKTQGMQGLTGAERDSFKMDHYDHANKRLSRFISKADIFGSDSDERNSSVEEEKEEGKKEKGKKEKEKEVQREDKRDHDEEEREMPEEERKMDEEERKMDEEERKMDEEEREMHEEEREMDEEEEEKDENVQEKEEEEKDENIQEKGEEEEEEYEKDGEKVKEKIVEEEQRVDNDEKEKFSKEGITEQDNQAQKEPFGLPQKPITQPEPKPLRQSQPAPVPVPDRLRLLISGHFRKDQTPIYLVQEYREEQNLFKDQKADFQSKRRLSENGIDAVISGRFYDENILEESGGRPVALNIKPHKIVIDKNRSNVYDDYFEQIYNFESFDISLTGEFLKSDITKRITPFLSLGVKKPGSPEKNTNKKGKNGERKPFSTTVFTCKLKPTVHFSDNF